MAGNGLDGVLSMLRYCLRTLLIVTAIFTGCAKSNPGDAAVIKELQMENAASHDLSVEEEEQVAAFMEKLIQGFNAADAEAVEDGLSHPGGDPRGRTNTIKFNQSLMDGGDRVKSWSARRWTEPDWDVMRYMRFHPQPTIWIDVALFNGKREYPLAFSCSPDGNGVLKVCHYVDR